MSKIEIEGISLKTLKEPIYEVLRAYQDRTNGALEFQLEPDDEGKDASDLTLTPDKPNTARSATPVIHLGEKIGDLYVIAFKPYDGTGDTKTFSLDKLTVDGPYPRLDKVVPRSKGGTHHEGHMTIVSHNVDDVHADPVRFAGAYDPLGLDGHLIKKIGELGQSATVGEDELSPLTTLTVGYRQDTGERFGDPHAVYNPNRTVQVAGFLAISDEVHKKYPSLLDSLDPKLPD